MRRVLYFLATNIAVLLVLSIVLRLLGVDSYLDRTGTGLDYWNLLVFAAVFGMGGSFISLLLSKWMAMRDDRRARDHGAPRRGRELARADRLAPRPGRGHRHARRSAIFDSPDPNAFATGARRDAALVAVSTGLLRGMTRDEVDARARPRDQPRRERRHGDAHPDPGRGEHLRAVPLARGRRRRRPRGVPQGGRGPRAGLLPDLDRRAGGARHPRQHRGDVVLAAARVPRRRRRRAPRRTPEDDRRARAPEGRQRRAAPGPDGRLRHLGQRPRRLRPALHDPPAPRRAHRAPQHRRRSFSPADARPSRSGQSASISSTRSST